MAKRQTTNSFIERLKAKRFNKENAIDLDDDVTINMDGIKKTFNYDKDSILNYLRTLEQSFSNDLAKAGIQC